MSKKRLGKMSIHTERLRHLTPQSLATAAGGTQLAPTLFNCPTRNNQVSCFCPVLPDTLLTCFECPLPTVGQQGGSRAC